MDLKDIFVHTPMENPEYTKVPIQYFPKDIIQHYKLNGLVHNSHFYIKIVKGVYGLEQAAILAYNNLSALLTNAGYKLIINSLGMWKHTTRRTIFSLYVDDFAVKYYSKDDVEHLVSAIQTQYTCKVD